MDTIPQIINTYIRDHNFGVRGLNLEYWAAKDSNAKVAIDTVLRRNWSIGQCSRQEGEAVWICLQNRVSSQKIVDLINARQEFIILDIWQYVVDFFVHNVY